MYKAFRSVLQNHLLLYNYMRNEIVKTCHVQSSNVVTLVQDVFIYITAAFKFQAFKFI